MEKDEWLNNIKKSAAKSKYMSLKDKNYVPTGVEKGFVIGDYTLVVKNPEAMQNYSRLTSAYRTFCCEEYNGLEVISNDIYERLHSGRKPDYQDIFSDIATKLDLLLINSVHFEFRRMTEKSQYDYSMVPDEIKGYYYNDLHRVFEQEIVKKQDPYTFVYYADLLAIKVYFERCAEFLHKNLGMNIFCERDDKQFIDRDGTLLFFRNMLDEYDLNTEEEKRAHLLAMCVDPFYQGYTLFREFALRFDDPDRHVLNAACCISPGIEKDWDEYFTKLEERPYANDVDMDSITTSNIEKLREIESKIMLELKSYGITEPPLGSLTAKIHAKIARNDFAEQTLDKALDKAFSVVDNAIEKKRARDFANHRGEEYENSKQGRQDKANAEQLAEEFFRVDLLNKKQMNEFIKKVDEVSPYNKTDYHDMVNSFNTCTEKDIKTLKRYTKYKRKGLASRIILGFVFAFVGWMALTVALSIVRDVPKLITFEQWESIRDITAYIALIAALVNMAGNAIYVSTVGKRWNIATLNGKLVHPSIAYVTKQKQKNK